MRLFYRGKGNDLKKNQRLFEKGKREKTPALKKLQAASKDHPEIVGTKKGSLREEEGG